MLRVNEMPAQPLRVGVISCANIALRSMIPALVASPAAELAGIASRSLEKAERAVATFGGRAFDGYAALLDDPAIDAVYIPLPTGLHEEWVTAALAAGKHAFVEKSFAMDADSAERMVADATERGLLLLENILFQFHRQTAWIDAAIARGEIGRLQQLRTSFCFPHRAPDDIRYVRELGGGALFDVGTYGVCAARHFLGEDVRVVGATLLMDDERGVDVQGTATVESSDGRVAQLSWGFGYQYTCSWELIGSEGRIAADRAFTSPPGAERSVRLERGRDAHVETIPPDDYYANIWRAFAAAVGDPSAHAAHHDAIVRQARLLDAVRRGATS